jgi:hypothetical protein
MLSNIFNLLLSMGCFPNKLNVAKVTPIFKADGRQGVFNYSPYISFTFLFKDFREDCV